MSAAKIETIIETILIKGYTEELLSAYSELDLQAHDRQTSFNLRSRWNRLQQDQLRNTLAPEEIERNQNQLELQIIRWCSSFSDLKDKNEQLYDRLEELAARPAAPQSPASKVETKGDLNQHFGNGDIINGPKIIYR